MKRFPSGRTVWFAGLNPFQVASLASTLVSLSRDCNRDGRVLETVPIDHEALNRWISRVPELKLNGCKPSSDTLAKRLGEFWLPDESILYIGQTSRRSLETRTKQYYKHVLGKPSPHRGGHWIKTLTILNEIFIHYAESSDPKETESRLIKAFISQVSSSSRRRLRDAERPFPFANLEFPSGIRKDHGISHQTKAKSPTLKARNGFPHAES